MGVMMPVLKKGVEVGGTVGFINGPEGKFTATERDPSFPITILQPDEYSVDYMRFMVEGKYISPITEKFSWMLGAGIGYASGKMKNERVYTMYGVAYTYQEFKRNQSFGGITYEIGPGLVYTGSRVNVEFGVFYASFPKKKVKEENPYGSERSFSEFKWNPVGIKLGVSF